MTQQSLFPLEVSPAEQAARTLIRVYVKRGSDPKWIRQPMGSSRPDGMYATIGGYIDGRYAGNDKIVVYRDMHGNVVNQVFSFMEIYKAVQAE